MTSLPVPFNNCEFKICDLRGQCIGEGKCHHPIKPTDESARTIADQAATIAQLEHALVSEAVNKQDYAQLQLEVERLSGVCDALLNHCDKENGECSVCSAIVCEHNDPYHFHHDGCPSCWQALATQPTLAERGYKDIKYLACSKCGVMPDEAIATRLRRVCTILKLTSAVPDDDLELYRSMFSVLGIIARKLEPQPAEYNPLNEGK